MESNKKREYSAPALEKGFEILELLAASKKPMSLAQISTTLERSKSELYRMTSALEKRGYLARDEGSDYFHVTNKLFDLGLQVPPIGTLIEAAYPIMRELAATIMQSCHIAVESQGKMVVIARVDSPSSIGFTVHLGHHLYLYESGSGQVLLSWMPEKQKQQAFEMFESVDADFEPAACNAIIEKIRENGYAKSKSPLIQGLEDISYPIFKGEHQHVIATLTVPYLKGKHAPLTIAQSEKQIKKAAQQLSSLSKSYSGI